MVRRQYEFNEEDKIRILQWCGRHCCLCGKFAGIEIEIAHLENHSSDIDDAIPLCFDCHAAIGDHNAKHPRGKKYSIRELKARRDQIYDKHTSHLCSPIHYRLTQEEYGLPKVGFMITNVGETYPVQTRVNIFLNQGERIIGSPETLGHYNGTYLWNLNPKFTVGGVFSVPDDVLNEPDIPLRAFVEITVYDIYHRPHEMLPSGYIKNLASEKDWFFEPSIEELKPKGLQSRKIQISGEARKGDVRK